MHVLPFRDRALLRLKCLRRNNALAYTEIIQSRDEVNIFFSSGPHKPKGRQTPLAIALVDPTGALRLP
jgi:hypothetical protein